MLKIIDNIDLKELGKYGFKFDNNAEWYRYDIDRKTDLYVKPISRQIVFKAYPDESTRCIDNITVLYDLIKDGLVERVNDNND